MLHSPMQVPLKFDGAITELTNLAKKVGWGLGTGARRRGQTLLLAAQARCRGTWQMVQPQVVVLSAGQCACME